MARLPFDVPTMSPEMRERTLIAHYARGLYWHCSAVNRFMWDFSHCLNLSSSVKFLAQPFPLLRELQLTILYTLSTKFEGDMADIDCNWLSLQARQLSLPAQLRLRDMINNIRYCTTNLGTKMIENATLPPDVFNRLKMSLASLEQALLAKDSMMPQHLRNTHSLLLTYPETVVLLEDSEIALIIDAAEVHTKTEIVKAVAKGGAKGGTRTKVSASDL